MADTPEAAEIALARTTIGRIDFFRSEQASELAISRLGGLTNLVFRVDCDGDSFVLRLPGAGTEDYIDRGLEAVAVSEAARTGVSPEVIFFDAESGVMVSPYIEARTMSRSLFKSVPGAPSRAGEVLRRLHRSGAKFAHTFDLFGMMDEYLRVLDEQKAELPKGFEQAMRDADALRRVLAARPAPLTACHCDPLAENFLDTGSRMWLVDWEFSGMNDPMWDLGDASVEAGLEPNQEAEMIRAYFGGAPMAAEGGRIAIYKAMCDLLWTQWGLIQHASKNTADDYWGYANSRFTRCRRLMADPSFAANVTAVTAG